MSDVFSKHQCRHENWYRSPQHQIWSPSLMLSPFQSSQVQLALRISASISITCCCAVLCSYALVKKFQTPVNHFVANLQFAILISCLAAVFGNAFVHSPLLCIIQGFILSSFILSAIIWFCSMAFHSYLYLFHYSQIDRFFKYYFAASFGVPPIMAAIPLADEGYSFSDFGLCYPRDDWVYIVYYGPLWLSMVFCIAIYIYIFYKLKGSAVTSQRHAYHYKSKTQIQFAQKSSCLFTDHAPMSVFTHSTAASVLQTRSWCNIGNAASYSNCK